MQRRFPTKSIKSFWQMNKIAYFLKIDRRIHRFFKVDPSMHNIQDCTRCNDASKISNKKQSFWQMNKIVQDHLRCNNATNISNKKLQKFLTKEQDFTTTKHKANSIAVRTGPRLNRQVMTSSRIVIYNLQFVNVSRLALCHWRSAQLRGSSPKPPNLVC